MKVLTVFDKFYDYLPAPLAGALSRALRAFISILIAAVIVAVGDGSIFANINFIPPEQVPLIIAILTPLLLGLDKYLRDRGYENEDPDIPTSGAVGGPKEPTDVPTEEAVPTEVEEPIEPAVP